MRGLGPATPVGRKFLGLGGHAGDGLVARGDQGGIELALICREPEHPGHLKTEVATFLLGQSAAGAVGLDRGDSAGDHDGARGARHAGVADHA